MADIYGGQAVARVLKEEGIEQIFGIAGHSIQPVLSATCEAGIKYYHMRHEQSASFAADGWARASGRPGICFSTAAPGLMNLLPGIAQASLCMSPVLALIGGHETTNDKLWTAQECYGAEMCRPMAKWTHRVIDWNMLSYYMRRALIDIMTYPPGPVVLDLPWNITMKRGEDKQLKSVPRERMATLSVSHGDPILVEKAVEMLLQAERPLIVSGDGIYWSKASEELRELAELLNVPVHTRRLGRGAIPENHRLSVTGGSRQPLLNGADLIIIVGARASYLDEWFEPPMWRHEARYIQVQEAPSEVFIGLPTDLTILGGHKAVLRQMIECARSLVNGPPERSSWLDTLAQAKNKLEERLQRAVARVAHDVPIHVHALGQGIVEFLDPSATIILDSAVASNFLTDKVRAQFAGQVLDSGLYQGVGHGVGMGIGAQLARPGKQVLVLMGDGGLGISGIDVETARRNNLPVVYVVSNNSAWVGDYHRWLFNPEYGSEKWITPNIRHDKIYENYGCHVEHVEKPEELKPALQRAFNSGITSLVEVVVADNVLMTFNTRLSLMHAWMRDAKRYLPPEALEEFARLSPLDMARAKKWLNDMSIDVSMEDLYRAAGRSQEEA